MTELRDCTDPATWWPHIDEAVRALAGGSLAVVPTDTVYGIAADAFTPQAVTRLLEAKGRGRNMPPPVLIADVRTMDGLATHIPDSVHALAEEFWPGPLTIILNAHSSLAWDLGETEGTVALRIPDHEFTRALLRRTGPLAVSSANKSGQAPAPTAADAAAQLGSAVGVYLDSGTAAGGVPSTIIDATAGALQIVRVGALSAGDLASVAPELEPAGAQEPPPAHIEHEAGPVPEPPAVIATAPWPLPPELPAPMHAPQEDGEDDTAAGPDTGHHSGDEESAAEDEPA